MGTMKLLHEDQRHSSTDYNTANLRIRTSVSEMESLPSPVPPCNKSNRPCSCVQALKPVLVVAVAVLYFYSAQPPSHLSAGQFMTISDGGLSACTFLPEPVRLGCKPLRATVSESGSLVVFQGDLKAEVPMGKEGQGGVLFVSRSPRWKKFEVGFFFYVKQPGDWEGRDGGLEEKYYVCR